MSDSSASITQIAADVQSRKRTARDIADAALAAAAKFQEQFHAFIKITPDIAREQARCVDEPPARIWLSAIPAIPGIRRELPETRAAVRPWPWRWEFVLSPLVRIREVRSACLPRCAD